jgi:hypothetical protein
MGCAHHVAAGCGGLSPPYKNRQPNERACYGEQASLPAEAGTPALTERDSPAADGRQEVNVGAGGDLLQKSHTADGAIYGHGHPRAQIIPGTQTLADSGEKCFQSDNDLPHAGRLHVHMFATSCSITQ